MATSGRIPMHQLVNKTLQVPCKLDTSRGKKQSEILGEMSLSSNPGFVKQHNSAAAADLHLQNTCLTCVLYGSTMLGAMRMIRYHKVFHWSFI
jgi:hypothetical protein